MLRSDLSDEDFFIDIDFFQYSKYGQGAYGDVFVKKKLKDENRLISVLSDGLGSGIKANVLATLTSTMAIEFMTKDINMLNAVSIIMKTLPVCKERKISYSTFTIVDIEDNLTTKIIEYDNPGFLKISNNKVESVNKEEFLVKRRSNRRNKIYLSKIESKIGDRIIFFSDGVSQSGLGSDRYPLGWGEEGVKKFVSVILNNQPEISSKNLAKKIVDQSRLNDQNKPKDDISCAVVYFRKPRSLIVLTGPPIDKRNDSYIAKIVSSFKGKKVICGGTTANIIAREQDNIVTTSIDESNPHHPPIAYMEGIDLITEGVITLTKVEEMLSNDDLNNDKNDDNASRKLFDMLLDSDNIQFIIGTRINEAHHDMNMPVELEVRRNLVKRISVILEEKHLKKTSIMHL